MWKNSAQSISRASRIINRCRRWKVTSPLRTLWKIEVETPICCSIDRIERRFDLASVLSIPASRSVSSEYRSAMSRRLYRIPHRTLLSLQRLPFNAARFLTTVSGGIGSGEGLAHRLELYLPQPEGRSLADVNDLGGAEEGQEGGDLIAFQHELADDPAELHRSLLALAPALPVVPAQVGGGHSHLSGTVEEGTKAPVDRRARYVEVRQLEDAAQHVEDQVAKGGALAQMVAHLDTEGRHEMAGHRTWREEGHGELRRSARARGLGPEQTKAGTPGAEPGAGHALHGQERVRLQVHRLAEQQEIETERLSRCQAAPLAARLEDVGAHRLIDAAQERRRLPLDVGLENPCVGA